MKLAALLIVTLLAGLQIYIRFSSSDPALWHIDLAKARPPELTPNPSPEVTALEGGAFVDLTPADPQATLARLAEIAAATPRTRLVAGSVAEGHITWETRSALWGFPDYTTAQITPQGLTLYARLRFGRGDMGVNAARLRAWNAAI